jgi:glucose-fructose oxidoreductase
LALVGADHLHFRGLIKSAVASTTAEVVGLVIDEAELLAHYRQEYSGLPVYASAAELYQRARPQAIITCADNRAAAAVVAEAAAYGVHVMKEKPMAASLALAETMATTAARAGVRLMINWPTNWSPAIHAARQLIEAGRIGALWQVHHRAGHAGPPADYQQRGPAARIGWGWLIDRQRNGGGAYIDFCSYGAVLSRWLMGLPSKVMAMGGRYAKEFFTVEDNAVLLLGYPRGLSVCEGSWTQPAVPLRLPTMLYGAAGSIAITDQQELLVATPGAERGSSQTETVTAAALPDHYRSAPDYFTHCLLHERPFEGMVTPELSRDAQEMLEAGLQSMALGQEVGIPLRSFLG